MKPLQKYLWLSVLFLGWAFDLLFWKKPLGINFFLFTLVCLAAGSALLFSAGHRPSRNAYILLAAILLTASGTFMRQEPLTTFLNVTYSLFLMSLLAVTYTRGEWTGYGVLDYLYNLFRLWLRTGIEPLIFYLNSRHETTLAEVSSTRKRLMPILRGALLALPILAVFAGLLASADMIFQHQIVSLLEFFKLERLTEYGVRLMLIVIVAYALAGVFLLAALRAGEERQTGQGAPRVPRLLGMTEAGMILGSVTLLFGFFVSLQFRYFFGGRANIHLEGYTYAEYARRGFGELVMVAVGSLLLLLVLSALTNRRSGWQQGLFSALSAMLVGLVMVILLSAYQRLILYEAAYGFSRLRTYTHVFLVWIGVLLVAILLLEIFQRERRFALAILVTSFGFVVTLNLVNVDGLIVRQNLAREIQRRTSQETEFVALDETYFLQLSPDAIPLMTQYLQGHSLPDEVTVKVAAVLACFQHRGSLQQPLPWQAFNGSNVRARQALVSVAETLENYPVVEDERGVWVSLPAGEEFFCTQGWMD